MSGLNKEAGIGTILKKVFAASQRALFRPKAVEYKGALHEPKTVSWIREGWQTGKGSVPFTRQYIKAHPGDVAVESTLGRWLSGKRPLSTLAVGGGIGTGGLLAYGSSGVAKEPKPLAADSAGIDQKKEDEMKDKGTVVPWAIGGAGAGGLISLVYGKLANKPDLQRDVLSILFGGLAGGGIGAWKQGDDRLYTAYEKAMQRKGMPIGKAGKIKSALDIALKNIKEKEMALATGATTAAKPARLAKITALWPTIGPKLKGFGRFAGPVGGAAGVLALATTVWGAVRPDKDPTEQQLSVLASLLEEQAKAGEITAANAAAAVDIAANAPRYGRAALTWGAPGAAIGGLAGAVVGKRKHDPTKMLLGAAVGGGLGAGAGLLSEELKYRKWLEEQGKK